MLIGLIGKKYSGKDTFGNFLIQYYQFHKKAFADPLKECCKTLFHLSDEQLNDCELKETIISEWNLSPRQIMQKVGTDLFRNHFHEEFWLKLFEIWYKEHSHLNIVCTDVRFENEAELIKKLGGILIKIDRPIQFMDYDNHESEQLLFNLYDFTIINDSSIDEYENRILELCNIIFKKSI